VALALALLVLVSFLLWGDGFDARIGGEAAREALAAWPVAGWLTGIGLLVADVALPIPATAVMAALGWAYGPVVGGILATVGGMAAGFAGYGLGRLLGRSGVERLLGAPAMTEGEALFARSGGWMVALSRWLPILPEVISCIAGIARMPLPRFAAALFCGAAPLGFTFAGLGALGRDAPATAVAGAAIVSALLWLAARRLANRRRAP
jgi:uncharacterized membrane protein YdjX (TVP38/TMEM64 family)